jgi:hypothetical protein
MRQDLSQAFGRSPGPRSRAWVVFPSFREAGLFLPLYAMRPRSPAPVQLLSAGTTARGRSAPAAAPSANRLIPSDNNDYGDLRYRRTLGFTRECSPPWWPASSSSLEHDSNGSRECARRLTGIRYREQPESSRFAAFPTGRLVKRVAKVVSSRADEAIGAPDRHWLRLTGTTAAQQEEAPQVVQPGPDVETLPFPVPWSCRILVRWNRQLIPSGGRSSPPRAAAGGHAARG